MLNQWLAREGVKVGPHSPDIGTGDDRDRREAATRSGMWGFAQWSSLDDTLAIVAAAL